MTYLSGLIKKDIVITIRKFNIMQILILSVAIIPVAVQFPQFLLMALAFAISFLTTIFVSMSFGYDANNKWDVYLTALPMSANQIVKAKYLLACIYSLFAWGIVTISYAFCRLFWSVQLKDYKFAVMILIILCCTYNAFQIPLIYKFGIDAGRYSMFFLIIVGYAISGLAI